MLVYNRKNKTKTTTIWKKTVNRNNVRAAFLACFQSINCFGCTHSSPLKLQELMPSSQKLVERHPPGEFNAYGFGMSACNLQWSAYVWPLKSLCLKKKKNKQKNRTETWQIFVLYHVQTLCSSCSVISEKKIKILRLTSFMHSSSCLSICVLQYLFSCQIFSV